MGKEEKNIYTIKVERKTKTTYYWKIVLQKDKKVMRRMLNKEFFSLEDAIKMRDRMISERDEEERQKLLSKILDKIKN